jgi:hypothetical protein
MKRKSPKIRRRGLPSYFLESLHELRKICELHKL